MSMLTAIGGTRCGAVVALHLLLTSCCSAAQVDSCNGLDKDVARVTAEVLAARSKALAQPHSGAAADSLGRLVAERVRDDTVRGDQALALLLNFYLGEANDEDILYEVVRRGTRMLPLLESESWATRDKVVCAATASYRSLVNEEDTRKLKLDTARQAIERGETWPD